MKKISIFLSVFLFTSILYEVHSAPLTSAKGFGCRYLADHHFLIHNRKTIDDMLESSKTDKAKMDVSIFDIDL